MKLDLHALNNQLKSQGWLQTKCNKLGCRRVSKYVIFTADLRQHWKTWLYKLLYKETE